MKTRISIVSSYGRWNLEAAVNTSMDNIETIYKASGVHICNVRILKPWWSSYWTAVITFEIE